MRKFIVALMIFVCSSSAFASGFKGQAGIEVGQSNYTLTVPFYNTEGYNYRTDTIRGEGHSFYNFRGSLGYEQDIVKGFSADLNLGLNTNLDARAEANVLYKVSDKVKVKAGPNISHALQQDSGYTYKPGIGGQVGVDVDVKDNVFVSGQYTYSQYSDVSQTNITTNHDFSAVTIGIGFRF